MQSGHILAGSFIDKNVSKIANKRRPKKFRPPYRRYVYKSNYTDDHSSDEEYEDNSIQDPANSKDFLLKHNLDIHSVYVLTTEQRYNGKRWPMSQFEKIDVLQCCLYNESDEYKERIEQIQQELKRQSELMTFPIEIIRYILEVLYLRGKLKPKFLRVNKLFYALVVPMIYGFPQVKAPNFFQFVETISSNKKIGENVRQLDLSYIIQSGKNAYVAKLLKRCKKNLEVFVAPQTSFGLGPLVALRNCENLTVLDLRLVSETLNLAELFNSIRNLDKLTKLSFPRSSIEMDSKLVDQIHWPPKLSSLRISGGISDEFLIRSNLPPTITTLEFAHCPQIGDTGIKALLYKFGNNLKTLKVEYPMRQLKDDSLDVIFDYCPNLTVLLIYVDYISSAFFDDYNLKYSAHERPLKHVYIDSSGMLGTSTKLHPIDLAIALTDGRLPNVKNIRSTAKLGWDPNSEFLTTIIGELEDRGGGLYLGY